MPHPSPDPSAEASSEGAHAADLLPLVYEELRRRAHRRLQRERAGHTLNTTGLVHEAYYKLAHAGGDQWQNPTHFLAVATTAMKQILLNYARDRQAQKRGGGQRAGTLHEDAVMAPTLAEGLLDLNEALERLRALSERQCRVVECRAFAGLTLQETADVLGVSAGTVKRDWAIARAWLNRELRQDSAAAVLSGVDSGGSITGH